MRLSPRARIAILFLISTILLFSYLGKVALIDSDETRYAEGAREMMVLKDYLIPHLNFEPRINKPALFYWLISVLYWLAGVNEFSARFPSALFGLILIIGTYLWIRNEIGERKAYLSSFVMLSTPAIFIVARIAITDIVFTVFIIFSLFSFWSSYKNRKFLGLGYLFLGLSLATKGPAGFVIVFLTLFFFSFWQRDKSYILKIVNPGGILIFLVIGGFWYYVLLDKIGWPEFKRFVFQETWGRLEQGFVHKSPFYYYVPLVIAGFLPWSIFLTGFRKIDLKDNFTKFLVTFTGVGLLFFSICRTKLPTYILPVFPALAIIDACILYRYWESKRKETLIFLLFMASLAILIPVLFPARLSGLVNIRALYKLSIFILIISTPLVYLVRFKLKYQFWYLFCLFFFVYFYLILTFGDDFSLYRSSKRLFYNQKIDSESIYTLNLFKPGMVFYSGRKIKELSDISEFKKGYLVFRRSDFESVRDNLNKPFRVISETNRYILIQVTKN